MVFASLPAQNDGSNGSTGDPRLLNSYPSRSRTMTAAGSEDGFLTDTALNRRWLQGEADNIFLTDTFQDQWICLGCNTRNFATRMDCRYYRKTITSDVTIIRAHEWEESRAEWWPPRDQSRTTGWIDYPELPEVYHPTVAVTGEPRLAACETAEVTEVKAAEALTALLRRLQLNLSADEIAIEVATAQRALTPSVMAEVLLDPSDAILAMNSSGSTDGLDAADEGRRHRRLLKRARTTAMRSDPDSDAL
jgi:hypothetical protein